MALLLRNLRLIDFVIEPLFYKLDNLLSDHDQTPLVIVYSAKGLKEEIIVPIK
jgi:hypothetical protein